MEEVNNNSSFLSKWAKDSSKSQTKENNSQSVGSRAVSHLFLISIIGSVGLDINFRNLKIDYLPDLQTAAFAKTWISI